VRECTSDSSSKIKGSLGIWAEHALGMYVCVPDLVPMQVT
jgi:hypothetical protein